MSFAHVQGTGNSSSGTAATVAATFSSTVAAGDLVVVGCASFGASGTFTVADSIGGNTWWRAAYQAYDQGGGNFQCLEVWYSVITNGGSSFQVTVTPAHTTYCNLSIDEYSFTGTLILDSASANTRASTAQDVGNLGLQAASDLAYGIIASTNGNGSTFTAAGSTNLRYTHAFTSGSTVGYAAGDQVSPAGSSVALGWTYSSANGCQALGVAFATDPGGAWRRIQGIVNHVEGTWTTSAAKALPQSVTIGDLVCVGVITNQNGTSSPTISSVTDSAGNTYTQAAHVTAASGGGFTDLVDVWYTVATAGGSGIAVSVTSAQAGVFGGFAVDHYRATGPITAGGSSTGSSTIANASPASGDITIAGNNLIYGAAGYCTGTNAIWTPAAGLNLRYNGVFVSGQTAGFSTGDKLNIASSPASVAWTLSTGEPWQVAAAAFAAASAVVYDPVGVGGGLVGKQGSLVG